MPGHKGKGSHSAYAHDITEIEGADVLYSPSGIILESERNAGALFGTARTVYSGEGSSLSVKTMLALVGAYAKERGDEPLVLVARNVHKSFVSAMTLLDFDVEWIYGDCIISTRLAGKDLASLLDGMKRKPTAVYLTSPDYLGNMADIASLAEVCHARGVLLLVDNAHGAHLKFLPEDVHPITLGADMCCDSAHKTLPVLTGGGYLHISKNAPAMLSERADEMMSLFASTSPSYLVLESLDLANAYLEGGYKKKLADFLPLRERAARRLSESGWQLLNSEPLKITLLAKKYGYTGDEVAKILEKSGYFVEFHDRDFLTVMLSPEFSEDELLAFTDALSAIPRRAEICEPQPKSPVAERRMSPREAAFAPSVCMDVGECEGRILASLSVSCPPAVPILISGEVVTGKAIAALRYYGTEKIRVVK